MIKLRDGYQYTATTGCAECWIVSITGITIKEAGEPGKGARFERTKPKGNYLMLFQPESPMEMNS